MVTMEDYDLCVIEHGISLFAGDINENQRLALVDMMQCYISQIECK